MDFSAKHSLCIACWLTTDYWSIILWKDLFYLHRLGLWLLLLTGTENNINSPQQIQAVDKSRVDHPGSVPALAFPGGCALLWPLPQQTCALMGLVQSGPDILLFFPLLFADRLTCWHSPVKESAKDPSCYKWSPHLPFPPPWVLASELKEQWWDLLLHIEGLTRVRSFFPLFSLIEIVWR